jgi:predicted DNA-binding protein (MmcQ/YjbR family)
MGGARRLSSKAPAVRAVWKRLREFALGLPEAAEEFPWGDRVAKVRKKIFMFIGEGTGESPSIALKLHGDAHGHALSLPGATPTAYNLGTAGWVTIPLAAVRAHPDLAIEWIEMSYALVAPKRLSKTLHS